MLLVAIMVLWRPSVSAKQYLFSPVQCDDECIMGQKNKRHEVASLIRDKGVQVAPPGEGEAVEVAPPEPSNEMVSFIKCHLL